MGNLSFNLLFTVLHYIFTIFSVTTLDGNVLFRMSMILLRYLNKEISKMLITIRSSFPLFREDTMEQGSPLHSYLPFLA